MGKYLFIGDSHQSALLPIKIALLLGIPFLMGIGYCSSTDWPNVSRFDGNGNGDGMVRYGMVVVWKKNWGWQLSSWQMFFLGGWEMSEFGGGKCPNFGGGKCPPGK